MELKVLSKTVIAQDTMAFEFEKPKQFKFTPGQTIDVGVGTMMNTFSIAAAPDESVLRIATRMRKESRFKQALMKTKKVRVQGPSGDFVLPPSSPKASKGRHIVLIAGGIGITPFYSMIKSRPPHKISLLYKNSSLSRAAFLDELKRFGVLISTLHATRYALYYIAGPPGFVAKYRKLLDEKGIPDDNIRTEEFSGY